MLYTLVNTLVNTISFITQRNKPGKTAIQSLSVRARDSQPFKHLEVAEAEDGHWVAK